LNSHLSQYGNKIENEYKTPNVVVSR